MLKQILCCCLIILVSIARADIPEVVHYQAVIRDNDNMLLVNQEVSMRVSLLQGSVKGEAVYVESHNPVTNNNGLVNIQIGSGNSRCDFSNINWGSGPYFIQIEIDPDGGTNYSITGISQILSVPYALYAKKSENSFKGDMAHDRIVNLADPVANQDAATKNYVDLLEERIQVLEDSLGIDPHCQIIIGDGVVDIDGNHYYSVIIGNQEWMAENLKTTRYHNEDQISTGLTNDEWGNATEGAYSIYPHEELEGISSETEAIEAYGLLYNWAATNTGDLCPQGWRVPSQDDWLQLEAYLIDTYDSITANNAGSTLKSCRQVDSPLGGDCNTNNHPRWIWQETFGTDDFGFSAHPAGYRHDLGLFIQAGNFASFWSRSHYSGTRAWASRMYSFSDKVIVNSYRKTFGFSVRCIKKR